MDEQTDLSGIDYYISAIRRRLLANSVSIKEEIAKKGLYFRVSLVGLCNFSCIFCHNEGAQRTGILNLDDAGKIFNAAAQVGFRRIQFTGGEPLLHPQLIEFVYTANHYFKDIGITTNGVFLPKSFKELELAGITRIHISLQNEGIELNASREAWQVPSWLDSVINLSKGSNINIRLNLTLGALGASGIRIILEELSKHDFDLKLLATLPDINVSISDNDLIDLEKLIELENERRSMIGNKGRLSLRSFRTPAGERCSVCSANKICKEESRALRLGADYILRPCLATRRWDRALDLQGDIKHQIEISALLALDY